MHPSGNCSSGGERIYAAIVLLFDCGGEED
jgi:hypothetical protein